MKMTKVGWAFCRIWAIMLSIILVLLMMMHDHDMLIIPITEQDFLTLPSIYYSFVILIVGLFYMLMKATKNYITLPKEVIVDFEERTVTDKLGNTLLGEFMVAKAVAFSKESKGFLLEFHGLNGRLLMLQRFYVADHTINDLLRKYGEQRVFEFINPSKYYFSTFGYR